MTTPLGDIEICGKPAGEYGEELHRKIKAGF